jgi:hypothetical protein
MIISSGSYPSMIYGIQLLHADIGIDGFFLWIYGIIMEWRQGWWSQKDLASGCCLSSPVSNIIKCE